MKKAFLLLLTLLAIPSIGLAQTGSYKPLPTTTPTPTTVAPATEASSSFEEVLAPELANIQSPKWGKPGLYLSGQIGAFGPADDQFEDEYDPDDGVAGNLIFGYRLNRFACLQAELGYYNSDGAADFTLNVMPLMAAARLGIPLYAFDIYVTGGVGAVFYKVEDYSFSSDQVAVATQLGAGINWYLTNQFFVGAETRYMMTDIDDAPNDGMMILGQIGWKF